MQPDWNKKNIGIYSSIAVVRAFMRHTVEVAPETKCTTATHPHYNNLIYILQPHMQSVHATISYALKTVYKKAVEKGSVKHSTIRNYALYSSFACNTGGKRAFAKR